MLLQAPLFMMWSHNVDISRLLQIHLFITINGHEHTRVTPKYAYFLLRVGVIFYHFSHNLSLKSICRTFGFFHLLFLPSPAHLAGSFSISSRLSSDIKNFFKIWQNHVWHKLQVHLLFNSMKSSAKKPKYKVIRNLFSTSSELNQDDR